MSSDALFKEVGETLTEIADSSSSRGSKTEHNLFDGS